MSGRSNDKVVEQLGYFLLFPFIKLINKNK